MYTSHYHPFNYLVNVYSLVDTQIRTPQKPLIDSHPIIDKKSTLFQAPASLSEPV